MAESTLTLTMFDLDRDIARFLGYPTTESERTTQEQQDVVDCRKQGYRSFIYPPQLEGRQRHAWSFLSPNYAVSTVADTSNYTMPDNFGGHVGRISIGETGSEYIEVTGEGRIREMQNQDPGGRPYFAAFRQTTFDGSVGQRWQMVLYPQPDAIYSLTFRYNAHPDALTASNPYPLGGVLHSETIREACLAAAESRLDDEATLHQQLFRQSLQASIYDDKRVASANNLGYNGDNSDNYNRGVTESVTLRLDGTPVS